MKRIVSIRAAANPQNRGKSGYARISWEAFDLVAGNQTDEADTAGRHRGVTWFASHLGQYRLLSLRAVPLQQRSVSRAFAQSFLGSWYWGAVHHWGYVARRPVRDLRHGRGLSAERD
jgi:trimethylamine-N-oxide reductase (cytochrome c)